MASNPPSSPSSSPRLPSPPPMAEDQTGSQTASIASSELNLRPLLAAATEQAAASRRIRPGTRAADMAEGPPLIELTQIDSAFPLTEHLKALHYSHTHPKHLPNVILPVTAPVAVLLATPPANVDRAVWLYELCRFLVQKVNMVVVSLFSDHPPCSAATCPEMRASEWQYLCAVHEPPKACCAIDYCCHTLDWAANVLTNPKYFPSRGGPANANTAPQQHQVRQLTNIFRRVYRIFAHAWFSHREMFWRVEGKAGLYVFFKTVCNMYNLLPEEGYTIPGEAEETEEESRSRETRSQAVNNAQDDSQAASPPPSILRRPAPPSASSESSVSNTQPAGASPLNTVISTGATARRHRQTPSTGGPPVETVMEENEDDESTSHPADRQAAAQELETDDDYHTNNTDIAQSTARQYSVQSFPPLSQTTTTQRTRSPPPPPFTNTAASTTDSDSDVTISELTADMAASDIFDTQEPKADARVSSWQEIPASTSTRYEGTTGEDSGGAAAPATEVASSSTEEPGVDSSTGVVPVKSEAGVDAELDEGPLKTGGG